MKPKTYLISILLITLSIFCSANHSSTISENLVEKSECSTDEASVNNSNNIERTRILDRYWVSLSGRGGAVFSQILMAYRPEATIGYDRLYDSGRNSVSPVQLYSILPTDLRRLSIQSRPPWDITDTVAIGFIKNNTVTETFNITLTDQPVDGIFTDPTIRIYIHDKVQGIYHDLKVSDFRFTTNERRFDDRFELVYQTPPLTSCDRIIIASNGVTKTWDGTNWSPSGEPALENPVIINAPYTGSLACHSLVLNSDITLNANEHVEIVNGVTGPSKIIMASSASVVQRDPNAAAPNVEITKTIVAAHRFDYIFFGTPIEGNFFSDFASAQASGATTENAFDLFYKYNTGLGGGWANTTTTVPGHGLIARVKETDPFIDATATADINITMDGVANNGDITLTATNNPSNLNGGTSHVLLANPYPSAIDGDKFIQANPELDGTIYIWNSLAASPDGNYTQADYIAYSKLGVIFSGPVTRWFAGRIPSAQGFLVRILPDATNPTTTAKTANITFNNCMRLNGENSVFYKNSPTSIDKFKINMTGDNGVFSQILVGYLPEGTLGYDRGFDAGRNSVSTAQFYSILENDGRRLSINARPSFYDTDVVPVGISKSNANMETFNFSLAEQEGVFNTPNITVHLHDKLTNAFHNLSAGDFSFSTSSKNINDRFEIVYKNTAINDEVIEITTRASLINNVLNVNSSNEIKNIQLFDLAGRLVQSYESLNLKEFNTEFNHSESVYIANINFTNGTVEAVKLIHIKN